MFSKTSNRESCIDIEDRRIANIATQMVFLGGALSILALISLIVSRLA